MKLLRKITIKTCGDWTVKRIKDAMEAAKIEEGAALSLLKVVGDCSSAVTSQTDKGTYTKLIGQFVGTDLTTGELYQSANCILPDWVGAAIGVAAVQSGSVRFAFEIGAQRQDSAVTGYQYVIKPLIEAKPTDAVAELMKLAGIEAPAATALEAPKASEVPAAAAAKPAKK